MQASRRRPIRLNRVVAGGRVSLALLSVAAELIDPSAVRYSQVALALTSLYLVYAVLLLVFAWRAPIVLLRWRWIHHAVDLAVFSLLLAVTGGSQSPFFAYLVFSLLSGMESFHRRGAVATAIAALLIYLAMGMSPARTPEFDLSTFLMRGATLIVVAALLIDMSTYRERMDQKLADLAEWPQNTMKPLEELVREMLEHAGHLLDVPRIVLQWECEDEPWHYIAAKSSSHVSLSLEPPGRYEPLLAESLRSEAFSSEDVEAWSAPEAEIEPWIHPEMQKRFDLFTFFSTPFAGEMVKGRLFFLDRSVMTSDQVVLAGIVARLVLVRIEQFHWLQRNESTAAEERLRLARDLHDGLLQSLTAAALHLQTIHRLIDQSPAAAHEQLNGVQGLIFVDQRELRLFIKQLRPHRGRSSDDSRLEARLGSLAERFKQQWNLEVDLRLDSLSRALNESLRQEIYAIVSEAVANVAKHARASRVHVEIRSEDEGVQIIVDDNGRGFPFNGRFDLATLTQMKRGPVTLKERIASLGGGLIIISSASGARLEIELPTTPEGARE